MQITENIWNSWQIIALNGKFVVKNLTMIRKKFEETVGNRTNTLVALDMSRVTQLDSSAITLLLNFQRRIFDKGGKLTLLSLSYEITEIFSIVGIDTIFTLYPNRASFEDANA